MLKLIDKEGNPIPYEVGTSVIAITDVDGLCKKDDIFRVSDSDNHCFSVNNNGQDYICSYNFKFKVHTYELHSLIKEIINESRR